MKIPMLKSFICGCSVRTGTLFIGWIHLITSFISVMATTYFGVVMIPILGHNETREYMKDFVAQYLNRTHHADNAITEVAIEQDTDAVILIIKALWIISIVFSYVTFAAVLSLLFGVYKEIRMCIIPWLILEVKGLVLSFVSLIIWLLYIPTFLFGEHGHSAQHLFSLVFIVAYTVFGLLQYGIWLYCFLTVFTHYRHLSYEQSHMSKNFRKL